jgi:hypothetical protein
MSHMALEKVLKAVLTEETRKLPPRTHNLIDLAQRAQLALSQEHQDFIGKITNASVVVRADLVTRYCAQLGMMGIHVDRAILYGSHARGEAKEGSDIDILIVSADFERLNRRERLEQLGTAAARLWQPIEAIACTPDELAHVESATFLEEIIQTGVEVEASAANRKWLTSR